MQGSVTGNKSVDKQQADLKFAALVRQQLNSGSARDVLLDAHTFLVAIQIGAACRSDDAAE